MACDTGQSYQNPALSLPRHHTLSTTLQASTSFLLNVALCVVWQLCGFMDDFLPELVIVSASLRPEHNRVTVSPEVSGHHYASGSLLLWLMI